MNFPIPFASTHHARAVDAALGAETDELLVVTRLASAQACQHLGSSENGLSAAEAEKRLAQYGPNLVTRERKPSIAAKPAVVARTAAASPRRALMSARVAAGWCSVAAVES